jgi:hypothetical protein
MEGRQSSNLFYVGSSPTGIANLGDYMTVRNLINLIAAEIHMLQQGSCGDGLFDVKQRRIEEEECKTALKVIKRLTGLG